MKKKIVIALLSGVFLVAIGVCIYGYFMLNSVSKTDITATDEELGISPVPTVSPAPGQIVEKEPGPDVLNIAFFGLDRRNPDVYSRSDSIMVVSMDRDNQKVKVSSLMRDMYVPIPDREDNRINAAYAKGGPELAIKTINTNFGLDIRDYVTVDFFGLEELIDKVGGIEIDVKANEVSHINGGVSEVSRILKDENPPYVSNPGLQALNGRQAVAYSRIRYVGNSDYERTERQRRVLNQLFKKIKSQGVLKLPGTINTILPHVETSLSNTEILNMAMEAMKFNTNNIDQFRLPVNGMYTSQRIRGMAVLVPDIGQNKSELLKFIYGAEYVNSITGPDMAQYTKPGGLKASGN